MRFLEVFKRNFYLGFISLFLIWVTFFDTNNLISQVRDYLVYQDLESTKKFYQDKIFKTHKDLKSLRTNPKELEKFARENYLMKKENEEIFLIEVEK